MKKILVTGGTGYIGSHACVELQNIGYDVIIIDNLSNSNKDVIQKIEDITGRKITFYEGDLANIELLEEIFRSNKIEAVIHFAALKCISESLKMPIEYYDNNIVSTINLLKVMKKYNVKKIIFSSSASVYGLTDALPVNEKHIIKKSTNPYGNTKIIIEDILKDLYVSDNNWSIVILRYFNPIGAHKSGLIGEVPNGVPSNLLPYVAKVACGELEYVKVFGNDYNTIDGTGVRDYIHVVDLAKGHLKALEKINDVSGLFIYNLGTGKGYSVLQVIQAFEKACNKKITYKIEPRRAGDVAASYADCSKAEKELGWKAIYGIDEMCRDQWNFYSNYIKNQED